MDTKQDMRRVGGCLVPTAGSALLDADLQTLQKVAWYLSEFSDLRAEAGRDRVRELALAARALIVASVDGTQKGDEVSAADSGRAGLQLGGEFADSELGLTEDADWYKKEFLKGYKEFYAHGDSPSLFGTKADYLWQSLDALLSLENITRPLRYFDGYHMLATPHEVRVVLKDQKIPDAPLSVIETVMDPNVSCIEGLVAQLAWCVEAAGHRELARAGSRAGMGGLHAGHPRYGHSSQAVLR